MKTLLVLLLLCLSDPGQSDCQTDCLTCSNTLPRHLSFNTMDCLSHCDADLSSAYLDLCRRALSAQASPASRVMQKRWREEVEAVFPEGEEEEEELVGQLEGDLLLPADPRRFDHMTLEAPPPPEEEAGQEGEAAGVAAAGGDYGLTLSKRFGGFVKGRHGYRKLTYPGRSYQKRYGGFIGIRKSARKWNNQKRFSEFLKQYLGMSARAAELDGVSEDLAQQGAV